MLAGLIITDISALFCQQTALFINNLAICSPKLPIDINEWVIFTSVLTL